MAGAETLGRADIARNRDGVWLSWLQELDGKQSLWLAQLSDDLTQERQRAKIADLDGRGRATRVPRVLALAHAVVLLWSAVHERHRVGRAARLSRSPGMVCGAVLRDRS